MSGNLTGLCLSIHVKHGSSNIGAELQFLNAHRRPMVSDESLFYFAEAPTNRYDIFTYWQRTTGQTFTRLGLSGKTRVPKLVPDVDLECTSFWIKHVLLNIYKNANFSYFFKIVNFSSIFCSIIEFAVKAKS